MILPLLLQEDLIESLKFVLQTHVATMFLICWVRRPIYLAVIVTHWLPSSFPRNDEKTRPIRINNLAEEGECSLDL